MSKKDRTKKPRSESVYATTAGEVSEINISYDPATDTVSFESPVVNTYNVTSYKRRKGDKVLNRTKIDGPNLGFNPSNSLKEYDGIIAIDTNTVQIEDRVLSVTGIVHAKWALDNGKKDQIHFGTPFCLEYRDLAEPKEKIGWMMALHQLTINGYFADSERVAVVVDAFLGDISKMNSRDLPIFSSYYLPEPFTLIYASADSGQEHLANKLIRSADKAANMLIKFFKDGNGVPTNRTVTDSLFKGFRVVRSVHGDCSWS